MRFNWTDFINKSPPFMDKKTLSESDSYAKYITPAIGKS